MRGIAARLGTTQPRYRAIRTLRNAHRETRDPIWSLLDALRHPRHLLRISGALQKSGIPSVEYNKWKSFLRDSSIESISNGNTPPWVLLSLISNKVRSSQQAHGPMLDLVYAHLDTLPKEMHGPLILVAAIQLARFNLVVPLRRLARAFLSTWIGDPSPYFNLFLQIISCIPNRTVESADVAVLLLKAMESRQLRLTSDTYNALLNDRFVTLQLTKYLQGRMVQEGFVPRTSHLEAYLRFFAKDGAIHDARRYYKAIHSRGPPPDPTKVLLDPSSVPQVRANTLMLSNSPSTLSAFTFLHQLAAKRGHTPRVVLPPVKPKLSRILHTKFLNIHDFTAALHVALRDLKCTSLQLLKIFARAPGGRPTVATYTVLIRGLLLRGDVVNAVSYWRKLLKSGVVIDSEALGTGVVAFTRAGQPYDAFMILQCYGSRSPNPSSPPLLRKQIPITQKTINDYMAALNRIQRPDIVFRIWDHMEKLYNVQPNALSLSILLQSARLAHRLDDTLSGALAQLFLKNPFRSKSKTTPPAEMTPHEAARSIHALLQSSRDGKHTSGIWHDLLPATAARKVFLQSLFGAAAEQEGGEEKVQEMLKVESPAAAVRKSVDDDPAEGNFGLGLGLGLGSGLRRLKPTKYVFEGLDDLVVDSRSSVSAGSPTGTDTTPSPTSSSSSHSSSQSNRIRSQYPTVIPTNATCHQYILLLILSSRSNEIPLLLAWMKYLGIQPSTSILALSLVAWSEVCVQAPLIERFQHGGGESDEGREYVRLVEWIKAWVGDKRLPGAKEIAKWGRIAKKVREEQQ